MWRMNSNGVTSGQGDCSIKQLSLVSCLSTREPRDFQKLKFSLSFWNFETFEFLFSAVNIWERCGPALCLLWGIRQKYVYISEKKKVRNITYAPHFLRRPKTKKTYRDVSCFQLQKAQVALNMDWYWGSYHPLEIMPTCKRDISYVDQPDHEIISISYISKSHAHKISNTSGYSHDMPPW